MAAGSWEQWCPQHQSGPVSGQPSQTSECNLYTFYYYAKCFLSVLLTFTTDALWNQFWNEILELKIIIKIETQSFWKGWMQVKNGGFVHGESRWNFSIMIRLLSSAGRTVEILENNWRNNLAHQGKVKYFSFGKLYFFKGIGDICPLRRLLCLCSASLNKTLLWPEKKIQSCLIFKFATENRRK